MLVAVDLNWFLQFVVLAFAGVFGLLYLVRNTASRFFVVDSNFDSSAIDYSSLDHRKTESMTKAGGEGSDSCAVCGLVTKKQCARCKMVKYCSEDCQKSHWHSEHSTKCKDLQSLFKANHTKTASIQRGRKALAPVGGSSKIHKPSNKILFPYEEFVEYFKWDTQGYPPCGLLNCGNSCFANVVLQCLSYTRPLVAYLLEKGHRGECQRDDWCFLCEFQTHVERACRSGNPFSPMNILSRLPNIGGNLGYGKQEDAHEFMRFAIDTMQSVCLDEFGGEKAVHPSYQTTTLVQHIFGGCLRSQVICAECNNVSNLFENMMDLTVEIHGDAGSLEECLDQFTAKESLHGDNMYKCDGCNAYVKAWKRLTIQQAPNILTIALKRFQSGRFGKLNKRVTFPETLALNPYMSELKDENVYKLYAVIVHVDMLNASFFGHYICYVKDFRGNWYRIDDCKVANVDLDEVLSQGAYMLLYSRMCARSSCLLSTELLEKQKHEIIKTNEVDPSLKQSAGCSSDEPHAKSPAISEQPLTTYCPGFKMNVEEELSDDRDSEDARGGIKMVPSDQSLPIFRDGELHSSDGLPNNTEKFATQAKRGIQPNSTQTSVIGRNFTELDGQDSESSPSISDGENANGCNLDVDVSLLRKLTDKSVVTENCFFKEGSIVHDVSAMDVTMTDVQDGNSGNYTSYTSMMENMEYGNGLQSSGDIQNATKKPFLAPGFLDKPKKGIPPPEDKASAKLIHMKQGCLLNNQRSYGNGGLLNNSDGMSSSMRENGNPDS